jgi:intracellular sulfur oxidation DsrE/DsrF family protein
VKGSKDCNELMLQAYVDGELDAEQKQIVMAALESDAQCRNRACELRHVKEWVHFAFEDERAPEHEKATSGHRQPTFTILRAVASVALLAVVFAAGWLSNDLRRSADDRMAAQAIAPDAQHVILHIGKSDESRFEALLAKTRSILDKYSSRGVQVEVVANAGGLDLLRTSVSRHVDNIKQLISKYPNVRFIACADGLERLGGMGQDTAVIEGVYTGEPAADHLIQRLTQGWTLIRI